MKGYFVFFAVSLLGLVGVSASKVVLTPEPPIYSCASSPCRNGGTCVPPVAVDSPIKCLCAASYYGYTCPKQYVPVGGNCSLTVGMGGPVELCESSLECRCRSAAECDEQTIAYGFGVCTQVAQLGEICGGFAAMPCAKSLQCQYKAGTDMGYCVNDTRRTCNTTAQCVTAAAGSSEYSCVNGYCEVVAVPPLQPCAVNVSCPVKYECRIPPNATTGYCQLPSDPSPIGGLCSLTVMDRSEIVCTSGSECECHYQCPASWGVCVMVAQLGQKCSSETLLPQLPPRCATGLLCQYQNTSSSSSVNGTTIPTVFTGGVCVKNEACSPPLPCPAGYTCRNNRCEPLTAIGCASSPCRNGGTCYTASPTSSSASYRCACPAGYTGVNCANKQAVCACPAIYDPVCGIDGITYENTCQLDCQTMTMAYKGICNTTTPTNVTKTCVQNCDMIKAPISNATMCCGSDGITYMNECYFNCAVSAAAAAGVRLVLLHHGQCNESETQPDVCALKQPCMNNGTCVNVSPITASAPFKCLCTADYTGIQCEQRVVVVPPTNCSRGCVNQPEEQLLCGNDGVTYKNTCELKCASMTIRYAGACMANDPCQKQPCLNGGRCVPLLVFNSIPDPESALAKLGFVCSCPTSYTGLFCEQPPTSPPCMCADNYAPVCATSGQTYSDECFLKCAGAVMAYMGLCNSTVVNVCVAKSPCRNGGTCYPATSPVDSYSYRCRCPAAYAGANCEQPVTPPTCVCPENYSPVCATSGQTYSNECFLKCVGGVLAYMGECNNSTVINACAKSPCRNGGTCTPSTSPIDSYSYRCRCPAAYTGANCEQKITPPTCACPENYSPVCATSGQTYSNECFLKCAGGVLAYMGVCNNSTVVDVCIAKSPCRNGGTCYSSTSSLDSYTYRCRCTAAFMGANCEQQITPADAGNDDVVVVVSGGAATLTLLLVVVIVVVVAIIVVATLLIVRRRQQAAATGVLQRTYQNMTSMSTATAPINTTW